MSVINVLVNTGLIAATLMLLADLAVFIGVVITDKEGQFNTKDRMKLVFLAIISTLALFGVLYTVFA